MAIGVSTEDRITMGQRESDVLKILDGVRRGKHNQVEAARLLDLSAPTDRRSSSLIKVQRLSPEIADLQVFREGYFSQ